MRFFLIWICLSFTLTNSAQQPSFVNIRTSNPLDTDFTDLTALKAAIGNARIVFLGEPDHEYGNIFEAKTRVATYLHKELGFNTFAFESGFYDLEKARQDIATGKDPKNVLNKSLFSTWTLSTEFQPLLNYISSQKSSLQVIGFDSQFSGEYPFETLIDDILKLAGNNKSNSGETDFEGILDYWEEAVITMADSYSLPENFNHTLFKLAHSRIRKAITPTTKTISQDAAFMLKTLENIEGMADDYHQHKTNEKTAETWKAKDSNLRDRLMAENLLYWLNKFPNQKIICWGATLHLSKDPGKLENEELKDYLPMGYHLSKALGNEQIYAMAFTGILPDSTNMGSLERSWSQTNHIPGFLNITSKSESFSSSLLDLKASPIEGNWKSAVDGIIYIGELKPKSFFLPELVDESPVENVQKDNTAFRSFPTKSLPIIHRYGNSSKTNKWSVCGRTINSETNEVIPYANIGIARTATGTSSDDNGHFCLTLSEQNQLDSVRIGCVGFKPRSFAQSDFLKIHTIFLEPFVNELNQVVIKAKVPSAEEILKKAIKAIPSNYNQEPYTQERFMRTFAVMNSGNKILDDYFESYDNNGYQKVPLFPIRYQGFFISKMSRQTLTDSSFSQLEEYTRYDREILHATGYSDYVNKRNNNFLNPALFRKYRFQYNGIGEENGIKYYIVTFNCKRPTVRNSCRGSAINFNGEIHINITDYAILSVFGTAIQTKDWYYKEFQFDSSGRKRSLKDSPGDWITKEYCYYKKAGNYYYLDKLISKSTFFWDDFEIYGLGVKAGKREREEGYKKVPKLKEYNPELWKDLPYNN